MRAVWKGAISFGLVNIPVALGVATKRATPAFRTLDAETLQPVRRQYVVPEAEAGEAPVSDTVKGFEVDPGRYVVITPDELDALRADRRHTIDITAFVHVAEIDPVHYDRSYYVRPEGGAERQYALLLEAMRKTGRAAVGRFVLSRREHLALIRPAGDALVLETLFYPEDVRPKDEIEDGVRGAEVRSQELDVAVQLIENLTRPFDPDEFEDERNRELRALIESRAPRAGETPETREPAVPDLMTALEQSVAQAKARKKAAPKRRGAASRSG